MMGFHSLNTRRIPLLYKCASMSLNGKFRFGMVMKVIKNNSATAFNISSSVSFYPLTMLRSVE
jgi:hypothetical protein